MSTVAQKLGIRPGAVIAVEGLLVDEVRLLIDGAANDVAVSARGSHPVDQLILVVSGADDVRSLAPGSLEQLRPGGRTWFWYRKGQKSFHRDSLQAALHEKGLQGVTLVSIDDTWSAMRVRERRDDD